MLVTIKGLSSLSPEQKDKITRSCLMGTDVLNWVEWENKIKGTQFKESKGMDGEQVLKLFQSKDVTITLEGYYEKSKVIGWTTLYGVKTHINTKFVDTFNEAEIFGNLIHEWCHILGFAHKSFLWVNKHKTVPYRMGYITRDYFVKYFSEKSMKSFVGHNNFDFLFEE